MGKGSTERRTLIGWRLSHELVKRTRTRKKKKKTMRN